MNHSFFASFFHERFPCLCNSYSLPPPPPLVMLLSLHRARLQYLFPFSTMNRTTCEWKSFWNQWDCLWSTVPLTVSWGVSVWPEEKKHPRWHKLKWIQLLSTIKHVLKRKDLGGWKTILAAAKYFGLLKQILRDCGSSHIKALPSWH